MALHKKHKRLLSYVAILGGCALLALTFFSVSQFEKAKYQASISVQLVCKNKLDQLIDADKNALSDETSKYHDAAIYWESNYNDFVKITNNNSAAYKGTAIPAYLFSMSTLVAFGLILKHAEKAKEKEDEEEVLRQQKQGYITTKKIAIMTIFLL